MQSEGALRSAAAHCFTIAQALYEEAKVLYESDRYPRAAALAVIGAEEFGKAIVYTVAALLPEQRDLLPDGLTVHELKHRICDLAEAAQIMSKEGWEAMGYPWSPVARLSDLFVSLAERGLGSLLDTKEARKYYEERRKRDDEWQRRREKFQAHPEKDWGLAFREPDLKNAALYVDLAESGKVLSPSDRVDEQCATVAVLGLEWFLEQYANLSSVISDDQSWQDFAGEVRGRLPTGRKALQLRWTWKQTPVNTRDHSLRAR